MFRFRAPIIRLRHVVTRFCLVLILGVCVLMTTECSFSDNRPDLSRQQNQASPNPNPSQGLPQSSYDFVSVDNILKRMAQTHGGCALILVKDGNVIYRKSFGAHGPDKIIPIASASKWLSGALIMSLVDEGKLSLDDTVSKYIPEFADDNIWL